LTIGRGSLVAFSSLFIDVLCFIGGVFKSCLYVGGYGMTSISLCSLLPGGEKLRLPVPPPDALDVVDAVCIVAIFLPLFLLFYLF
jgi:hypothetical protein